MLKDYRNKALSTYISAARLPNQSSVTSCTLFSAGSRSLHLQTESAVFIVVAGLFYMPMACSCRWRAATATATSTTTAAQPCWLFALPHLLRVLVHYVCSTLHSAASVKRLETRTLVVRAASASAQALSLSLCSAALSQLLRSLAYCMRLAAQSARLFIVCCSYDLRFSCCCLPSLTLSPLLTIDGRTVAAAGRNYATCWNFTRLAWECLLDWVRCRRRRHCRCPCASATATATARACAPFAILIHLFCFSFASLESQMSKTCKLYASRSQPTQIKHTKRRNGNAPWAASNKNGTKNIGIWNFA